MKTLRLLIACALLLAPCSLLQAQTPVRYAASNFVGLATALTNALTITPVNAVTVNGSPVWFASGPPHLIPTVTNGVWTNYLYPNTYRLQIAAVPLAFLVTVIDTNVQLNLASNVIGGGVGTYTSTNNANFQTKVSAGTSAGYVSNLLVAASGIALHYSGGTIIISNTAGFPAALTNTLVFFGGGASNLWTNSVMLFGGGVSNQFTNVNLSFGGGMSNQFTNVNLSFGGGRSNAWTNASLPFSTGTSNTFTTVTIVGNTETGLWASNTLVIHFTNADAGLRTITNLAATLALINSGNLTNQTNIGLSPVLWALSNSVAFSNLSVGTGSGLTTLSSNAVLTAALSNAAFAALMAGNGTALTSISTNTVWIAWTNLVSSNNQLTEILTNLGLAGVGYILKSNVIDFRIASKFYNTNAGAQNYILTNTDARDFVTYEFKTTNSAVTFVNADFLDDVVSTNGQNTVTFARWGTKIHGYVKTNAAQTAPF